MYWDHSWILALVATALVAWWLMLRPGASYRGMSPSASCLIIALAVLLSVLSLRPGPRSASAAPPMRSALHAP